MGQGQADIALQLLHDCGRNGEWLCLKNLHLVTAWLPTLEKVSTFKPALSRPLLAIHQLLVKV